MLLLIRNNTLLICAVIFIHFNPSSCQRGLSCPQRGIDCYGEDIEFIPNEARVWMECAELCDYHKSCAYWTFHTDELRCDFKWACSDKRMNANRISGHYSCDRSTSTTSATTLVTLPTCPPCAAPTRVVIPTCPPCADPTPVAAQVDCPDCDDEVKKIQDQYKGHIDKVTKMNGGFFLAAVHSDPSWNIPLDYIPEFTDIEKTTANFLRDSTVGTIMYGDSSRNEAKVKLYQNSADKRFVRVEEIDSGNEYIQAYDQDKNLLKEGIFRHSIPNGDTALGNRLFGRDGRKEDRIFRLYRFNNGNIYYYYHIKEEGSNEWKLPSEYRFNPDTFTWTNLL